MMKHVWLQQLFLSVLLYPAYKNHVFGEVKEQWEHSFLQALKNAAAQNFTHVLEGKVSGWAAAWANASPCSLATRYSAFVVFASCLWRSSRNDVDWCNTIWWSSPPIRVCIVNYLNHFIQCVARMSNWKLFVQSCCDALELVPPRPFFFVCLKWQCITRAHLWTAALLWGAGFTVMIHF